MHTIRSATPRGGSIFCASRRWRGLVLRRRGAGLALAASSSVVIGFGGYPTVPPLVAASLLRIPTVLHEANGVMARHAMPLRGGWIGQDGLVRYILAAANLGVEVISYADPAGQLEIVGPQGYKQVSGRSTYRILKRVEGKLTGTIIHLCGRTSLSLEKGQFCAAKPQKVPDGLTYGSILCDAVKMGGGKLLGHYCLQGTSAVMKTPVIWQLELL